MSLSTSALEPIKLTIIYRGSQHVVSVHPNSSLSSLQAQLKELTSVHPSLQKLLYKGKKTTLRNQEEDATVAEAGLKDGMKVQLLGATMEELGNMKKAENAQRERENILRERALKPQAKVRSTGPPPSKTPTNYRFHQLVPLPHLPNPSAALAVLTKLSEDPAIRHVMQKHRFSVGTLTELAPHEDPHLSGLNVNRGESIKLRLRTNSYDGFRSYKEVRRVLCHELAHNVWGNHEENFKQLNSMLNREVAEFELAAKRGTHSLSEVGEVYEPPETEMEAHVHVLGGRDVGLQSESVEERRQRILDATMARLQKQEEELEHQCVRSSSNKSGVLRQGTLSFASTKRTATTSTAGKQKKAAQSTLATTTERNRNTSTSGSESSGASTPLEATTGFLVYKGQKEEAPRSLRPAKRRHVSPSPEVALPPPRDSIVVREEERPRLDPKDKRWGKIHKAAKTKMDNAMPVHAENENRIHAILRIFDLSDEYGPCIGVSRLERWERAHAMGLKPPEEIREILNTIEGSENIEYSQCVFHDLV